MDWQEIEILQKQNVSDILNDRKLKQQFISLCKILFQTNLCAKCNSSIKQAFLNFKSITPKQINTMEKREFILKPNTVLWVESLQKHVTNANLTDDIALALLNKNKGYAKYFEKIPANWQQVQSAVPVKSQTPVQVTKQEDEAKEAVRKAIVESIGEMTMSELKEYAQERNDQFPEWHKQKSKQKLVDYIVSLLA